MSESSPIPRKGGADTGVRSPSHFRAQLSEYVGLIESLIGRDLPSVPRFRNVPEIKKFCSGLLCPEVHHPWRTSLSRLGPTRFYSVAHSLFLFRKVLPSAPDPQMVHRFVKKMEEPSPVPNQDFLDFCTKEVRKIFRNGWDRRWVSRVEGLTVPTTSCLENSRMKGGGRGWMHKRLSKGQPESQVEKALRNPCVRSTLRALGLESIPPSEGCKVVGVPDGGKWRVVTVNSIDCLVLRPLHQLIYDHLCRQPWLLRGEATPTRLRSAGLLVKTGETFVSGDYESATDNLNLHVYKHLLREVAKTSGNIPDSVWSFANDQSERVFLDGKGQPIGRQGRGQLMGSYLSFPFLCLTNFLTLKWSLRRHVPVLINGDDIVFRCRPEEVAVWRRGVAEAGLVLSEGKTVVDERFLFLNSTGFRACQTKVHFIPFLRAKAYFERGEEVDAIEGQFRAFVVGAPGKNRRECQVAWLVRHTKWIMTTQRSVTRSLGLRVSREVLRQSGLWDRERFYLSVPGGEPSVPTKEEIKGHLPVGFKRLPLPKEPRLRRAARWEEEEVFYPVLSDITSILPGKPVDVNDYWRRVREGTYRFSRVTWRRDYIANFGSRYRSAHRGRVTTWNCGKVLQLPCRPCLVWQKERPRPARGGIKFVKSAP